MLFTLPNGKTINITVNQFLEMSDEDIQYLVSINYGGFANSPWAESSVMKKKKSSIMKEEYIEEEESIISDEEELEEDDIIPEETEGPENFPEIED